MSESHFDAYNEIDGELGDLASLLTAALCVREHHRDLNVISDLLYLAEKKGEIARKLVLEMHLEHSKLEKGMNQPATPLTKTEGEI